MGKKLFLIDGHSLIFRMYYAFFKRPMINSKGADVSILYGFTKYVLELLDREKPDYVAVCFDPPGKTFRHKMYPEYKGTRQATPELVKEALDPLVEICQALDIPVLMVPGYEGDDVLGSMAVREAAKGIDVYMVTPDKDFGQLVSEHIFQCKPGKAGAPFELFTPSLICEKFGISSPSQVIDMLAICGDTADNVPGVNGVGEVGASKLVSKYGSVENIYAHLAELSPRQAEQFRAAQNHIALSKTLVTIVTDVPLETQTEDMALKSEHGPRIAELIAHYEFPSLGKYIHVTATAEAVPRKEERPLEWESVSPEDFCRGAEHSGRCSIVPDGSGESVFSTVGTLTLATREGDRFLVSKGKASGFVKVLENESVAKTGYSLKQTFCLLANEDIMLAGKMDDIELMHYLINPEKSHKADMLCRFYLDMSLDAPAEDALPEPQAELDLFASAAEETAAETDHSREAVAFLMLGEAVLAELKSQNLDTLYYRIEEPLQRVLARMEMAGVKLDLGSLAEFAASLGGEMKRIEAVIREKTGEPQLNVASPKQVGITLFEKLRIDPRMKPKDSYPTDEETLMAYADRNPIIYDILEYRAVRKLLSTYIEPFGNWISPRDGRIHTTFNQALTATGRLSSSRPNLQNIPVRTERGQMIRKAFVASSPDNLIVSADYSQIELRIMAHFCGDTNMRAAFCNGQDVHATTAAKIFSVPVEDVTPDMRRTAKTANFGIMYGISAFGLAQRLHIPRVAAKKIIEDYFAAFPSIAEWIEKTRREASEQGYVQTLFGRRRYLPDINSRNATVRALAERNAVNAPIQGTAADIIKMAMNRVDLRLRELGLESRMVLQIHDELMFEAPRSEVETLMNMVKQEMEHVIELSIPLTVECNYGENWLEAH